MEKLKKARCFKNIKTFPCEYFNNNAAWMTTKIFLKFLDKFEKNMEKPKRNFLLFIHQRPAYPTDLLKIDHVKVVFFPPNCTSKLQPLDLRLILCFKVHNWKTSIRRYLAKLEKEKSVIVDINISVHDAMNMVCAVRRSISEKLLGIPLTNLCLHFLLNMNVVTKLMKMKEIGIQISVVKNRKVYLMDQFVLIRT